MTSPCALGLACRCKGRCLFTVVPVGCSGVDLVFSASPAVPPTPLPGELRETPQQSTYVVGQGDRQSLGVHQATGLMLRADRSGLAR